MGRNGSGKSSLLWAITGVGPRKAGRAEIDGIDTGPLTNATARTLVGLVPQTPADLLYLETVAAECAAADDESARPAGSCAALLDRLVPGIDLSAHPRDLSEGQRLSVVLAVQLTAQPPVLLLDEPTRGLDYGAKHRLAEILTELAAAGRAVLVSTHDVEFVATVAGRVVVMADGEVVADGPAQDVIGSSPMFAPQVAKVLAPARLADRRPGRRRVGTRRRSCEPAGPGTRRSHRSDRRVGPHRGGHPMTAAKDPDFLTGHSPASGGNRPAPAPLRHPGRPAVRRCAAAGLRRRTDDVHLAAPDQRGTTTTATCFGRTVCLHGDPAGARTAGADPARRRRDGHQGAGDAGCAGRGERRPAPARRRAQRHRDGVLRAHPGRPGVRSGIRFPARLHIAVRIGAADGGRRAVVAVPDAGGGLDRAGCGPAAAADVRPADPRGRRDRAAGRLRRVRRLSCSVP